MRARTIVLAAVVAGLSAVAAAQLGSKYAGWADGPEGFLLTKKEQKEWKELTSDAEAERFVELFWARRDPNLESPTNEFKGEFDRRVDHADQQFAFEGHRGALSDRGRIMILMGPPHQAEKRAPTHTVERMDDANYGSDEVRANAELWFYDVARLPAGFKTKGLRLLFVFYERKAETNEFILDRSHPEASLAMRALSAAPEVILRHPDLREPPKPVAVAGGKAADAAHLAWLDVASAPLNDRSELVLEPGVADAAYRPLWAQLILPRDAPALDELAGRVTTPEGRVTATFQIGAKPLDAGTRRLYHLTFPLDPGAHRVEVAGAAGGQVQVVLSGEAELAGVPEDGTWMSPIWVGLDAFRDEGVPLGSAYGFGGWHLVPLVDGRATTKDEVSYFGFLAHPGTTDAGATNVSVKVMVKHGSERLGPPFTTPLLTAELLPGLHLYANALSLAGLPEAGEYTLEFTIKDNVSGAVVERALSLDVTKVEVKGGVTYANFERISTGASLQEVREILGGAGTLQAESGSAATTVQSWTWSAADGPGVITVMFVDGKVSTKAQAGL